VSGTLLATIISLSLKMTIFYVAMKILDFFSQSRYKSASTINQL